MKALACIIIGFVLGVLFVGAQEADAAPRPCYRYHGRDFIICAESGPKHMPNGLRPGTPHPGPSSASGPCGMLAATRRQYGGDSLRHCAMYMRDRYGTWAEAERHHRSRNWW